MELDLQISLLQAQVGVEKPVGFGLNVLDKCALFTLRELRAKVSEMMAITNRL
jgi:hypothetical protein